MAILGLKTKEAVTRKWQHDFVHCKKDQVETLNDLGLPSGTRVWRIYVQTSYVEQSKDFKDALALAGLVSV